MARFRFHSFRRRLQTTRASNGRVPAISARAPLDTLAQSKAQQPNSRRLSAEMTKFSFSTGLRISKNLAELARSPRHHDAILVAPVLTLQLVLTFFLPFSSSLPLSVVFSFHRWWLDSSDYLAGSEREVWFKRGCETRRREEEGAVIVGEQARTHTQLPQDPFWKEERENVKSLKRLEWSRSQPEASVRRKWRRYFPSHWRKTFGNKWIDSSKPIQSSTSFSRPPIDLYFGWKLNYKRIRFLRKEGAFLKRPCLWV